MVKIRRISLNLNFTLNTLGCYGVKIDLISGMLSSEVDQNGRMLVYFYYFMRKPRLNFRSIKIWQHCSLIARWGTSGGKLSLSRREATRRACNSRTNGFLG